MLYDIRLTFRYEYEAPANGGRHLLRMVPRTIDGVQRVIAAQLNCEPHPAERIDRRDFFGNDVVSVRYDTPIAEEVFSVTARVERYADTNRRTQTGTLQDLARDLLTSPSLDPASPHHFLQASPLVGEDHAVTAWARHETTGLTGVSAIVERIGLSLHALMTFDPDSTAVDMPLGEAFAARRGVCQDFTHIMIAALRSLGIPAGYVSGFLRTNPPEGQERLEGADAMHAWVRAWCGQTTGWIEFDPTNDKHAGEDHIVVAYGRDYFDVAPVKGSIRMTGGQATKQAVDVVPLTARP